MEQTRSLAFVGAVWTSAAVSFGTAAYVAVEYTIASGLDETHWLQHLWHVVALGGMTYFALAVVLRRVVGKPLRQINSHLYRIGLGHIESLDVATRVSEVQTLCAGVNLMVQRIAQAGQSVSLDEADLHLRELRALAATMRPDAPESSDRLLTHVQRLQEALTAARHTSMPPPPLGQAGEIKERHDPSQGRSGA